MRDKRYDFARAAACCFVVAVHCHAFLLDSGPLVEFTYQLAIVPLMACNAVFFMLSGRLNLKAHEGKAETIAYYRRRARDVLVPMLALFLLRAALQTPPTASDPLAFLKTFALGALYQNDASECWFLFDLVGMLAAAPILALATSRMRRFDKGLFLVLGLGYGACCTLSELLGASFAWSYPFSGFLFYFILGSFIEDYLKDRKLRVALYVLTALLIPATAVLMLAGGPRSLYSTSPTFVVIAVAMYSLLLSIGERFGESSVVRCIARHSFTVYLIHMLVLTPLLSFIGARPGLPGLLRWLISTPLVLIVSLGISAVLDALIIDPLKRLFDRLVPRASENVALSHHDG